MASAYDKLRRILSLEQEQGYRDRAVVGGLSRFLTYWEREAREESEGIGRSPAVAEVVGMLSGYADLSLAARRETLDRLLDLLVEEGSHRGRGPESGRARPSEDSVAGAGDGEQMAPHRNASQVETARSGRQETRSGAPGQLTLDSPITRLKGVGQVMAARLERLGLRKIRDLLHHFPRRYNDFSDLRTINRLAPGEEVTIVGIIQSTRTGRTQSGKVITRAVVTDGTGSIEVQWFNQRYLANRLKPGNEVAISGKVGEYLGRLVFNSPEWEPLRRELLHTARLVPVYPLTEGIKGRWMRRLSRATLDYWAPLIMDPLPPSMLKSTGLMQLGTALEQIHFPASRVSLQQARQRLCFDEFFLVQLGLLSRRHAWRSQQGRALAVPWREIDGFVSRLPFQLTEAQQRAINDILGDLEKRVPMSRLLQGDVGSGKTVVAVAAMLATVRNGLQAAVMAPTSILAEQHYRTISRMLEGCPETHCTLLTGRLSDAEKRHLRGDIFRGRAQIVVGTHALIQASVDFARLGLVVVDEQHRFGVAQRAALRGKGTTFAPHLLAMSATPIPRTLALTVYGDMDISVLDEMPPNRQRVVTAARDRRSRERIYSFIESQVAQGRQAFIICPLVEESDRVEAKAAVAEHRRLQEEIFPRLRLGLLHGRMDAEEKERSMTGFRRGEYDILVSTPVVEVGIDVPNATVMLIEGADRFGLAQLHQFRGRVGRGQHKSYCILLFDDPSEDGLKRMQIIAETDDGFALAEKDLQLRGPGDFFGMRQHGLPRLRVAKLSDTAILERARSEALRVFQEDPDLARPEHRAMAMSVRRFWRSGDVP